MNILDIVILLFIIIESLNVAIIYLKPDFKYGNSIKPFKMWEKSKENKASHLFASYMLKWVAGSKIIFIGLLTVILVLGTNTIKVWSIITMIITISLYYFKLSPIIKELDQLNEINPKGYSKKLDYTILLFIVIFIVSLIIYYI